MSEHQDGIGEADGLERLWTPYRMAYIRGENKPADGSEGECPFCRIPALDDDEAGLVVRRGRAAYAVLNLYPYAAGHLMVCPYRHIADYTEVTDEESAEIAALTRAAMRTIRAVSHAEGFNVGMNQGTAGGAGIRAHLHQHVVPRWVGDSNFMPVIGHTKTLPQLLQDTRTLLADAWSCRWLRCEAVHGRASKPPGLLVGGFQARPRGSQLAPQDKRFCFSHLNHRVIPASRTSGTARRTSRPAPRPRRAGRRR